MPLIIHYSTPTALRAHAEGEIYGRPGTTRRRFVQQMEEADCGAVCLTMVLGGLGIERPLHEVRSAVGATAFGTNMRVLIEERFIGLALHSERSQSTTRSRVKDAHPQPAERIQSQRSNRWVGP